MWICGLSWSLAACTGTVNDMAGPGQDDPDANGDGTPDDEGKLGGAVPVVCDPKGAALAEPRLWRLTWEQYRNSIHDLLGTEVSIDALPRPFNVDDRFLNEARNLRLRDSEVSALHTLAQTVAKDTVSAHLGQVFACTADQAEDATCKTDFVRDFGLRAFRRPLDDEEAERFEGLYDLGQSKLAGTGGVQVVIEAMLQSPSFLFRSELGEADAGRLTGFETASALSYFLVDTTPDAELLTAAAAGELDTDEGVETQALRLMKLPEARRAAVGFFEQLFEYGSLDDKTKLPELYPDFDALKPSLRGELASFVEHLVFDSKGDLSTLLTAPYTFADPKVAALYGQMDATGTERIELDPKRRAGVLTMPGLMSVLAGSKRTSVVNRGRFVRARLLCNTIQDPPPDVDVTLPDLKAGLSAREQLEAKTSSGSCAGCHTLMNPVGFGFESLDLLGRERSEENGIPIDATGELTGTRDIDGPFEGPVELAHKLASSEQVSECMSIQLFRYAMGRAENSGDACAIVELNRRFEESDHNLRELLLSAVRSDAFLNRQR